jgi:hypothetical protein
MIYLETIRVYSAVVIEDHLCGPLARVPGYSSRDPASIPDATRFSEKK